MIIFLRTGNFVWDVNAMCLNMVQLLHLSTFHLKQMLLGIIAWGYTPVNHLRSQALCLAFFEKTQTLCLAGIV